LAAGVNAGEGADGPENFRDGRLLDMVDLLHDFLEGRSEVLAAANVEARGAGVTVDGGLVAQMERFDEPVGAGPVDILVFELFDLRVIADLALAGVTVEAGDGFEAKLESCAGFLSGNARGGGFGGSGVGRGRVGGRFGGSGVVCFFED